MAKHVTAGDAVDWVLLEDEIRTYIHDYLETLHTTLWGRAFDLMESREKAASWFAGEMIEVLLFMTNVTEADGDGDDKEE